MPGIAGMIPGIPGIIPGIQPVTWMKAPQNPNVPTGLEHLAQVNQLVVQQKVELLESVVGFEQANGYEVKNALGPARLLGPEGERLRDQELLRPFQISLVNNLNVEVLRIDRPLLLLLLLPATDNRHR